MVVGLWLGSDGLDFLQLEDVFGCCFVGILSILSFDFF